MSASLYWEPVVTRLREDRCLNTSAPSSFIETLEMLTGSSMPCQLNEGHLPALRALAMASMKTNNAGYAQLAKAIEAHGEILVTAVY